MRCYSNVLVLRRSCGLHDGELHYCLAKAFLLRKAEIAQTVAAHVSCAGGKDLDFLTE